MCVNWNRPLPPGYSMKYNTLTKRYKYVDGDGISEWFGIHWTKWGCTAEAWRMHNYHLKKNTENQHWKEVE